MYCVYILFSKALDSFYIGSTSNLEVRLRKHFSNHRGFTGKSKDWEIVYKEEFSDQAVALKRERQIKCWKNGNRIRQLIARSGVGSLPDCAAQTGNPTGSTEELTVDGWQMVVDSG
jgi:putative endonuclease